MARRAADASNEYFSPAEQRNAASLALYPVQSGLACVIGLLIKKRAERSHHRRHIGAARDYGAYHLIEAADFRRR